MLPAGGARSSEMLHALSVMAVAGCVRFPFYAMALVWLQKWVCYLSHRISVVGQLGCFFCFWFLSLSPGGISQAPEALGGLWEFTANAGRVLCPSFLRRDVFRVCFVF